jgi:hypothetical protein
VTGIYAAIAVWKTPPTTIHALMAAWMTPLKVNLAAIAVERSLVTVDHD